jgi:hypothetical protein
LPKKVKQKFLQSLAKEWWVIGIDPCLVAHSFGCKNKTFLKIKYKLALLRRAFF